MPTLQLAHDATLAEYLMTNVLTQLTAGNRDVLDTWLSEAPDLHDGLTTPREHELFELVDCAVESAFVDEGW